MNIIFSVSGGIGKNIMATAVCKGIKAKYPDSNLIVICGYPEIFVNNPFVYRIYGHHQLNFFYENHIRDQQVLLLNTDPYNHPLYILQKRHLIQVWFECCNLTYNGEVPEIYNTGAEQELYLNNLSNTKPRLVFHPFGQSADGYNWVRDIPPDTAQALATHFSEHFEVLHIRTEKQRALENTTPITTTNLREVFQVIKHAHAGLYIDSFAQHAAAAMQTPGVVCWIKNLPTTFGYSIHNNILANPPNIFTHNTSCVFEDYSFMSPIPAQCPYAASSDIFNLTEIINAVTNSFIL